MLEARAQELALSRGSELMMLSKCPSNNGKRRRGGSDAVGAGIWVP